MSTNVAKPAKVAIIGASGTYGKGILARAEEIGIEAVVEDPLAVGSAREHQVCSSSNQ